MIGKKETPIVPIERQLGLLNDGRKEWQDFIENFDKIELPEDFMCYFK
jgi:hypothetical protein